MARAIPATLQAEFDKPVTRVGYLLELSTSPPLRWSDLGTLVWKGNTFIAYDFTVQGLVGSGIGRGGTLQVQNLDDAAAAALVSADMSALTCSLWAVAPTALDDTGPGGPLSALLLENADGLTFENDDFLIIEDNPPSPVVKLGQFSLGEMEIELDALRLRLIAASAVDAFAPRRRVDTGQGFNYALPEGTQIPWEGDIYVVGDNRA